MLEKRLEQMESALKELQSYMAVTKSHGDTKKPTNVDSSSGPQGAPKGPNIVFLVIFSNNLV